MTVKDLTDALSKLNPDARVLQYSATSEDCDGVSGVVGWPTVADATKHGHYYCKSGRDALRECFFEFAKPTAILPTGGYAGTYYEGPVVVIS